MRKTVLSAIVMLLAFATGLQAQDIQAIAERLDYQRYEFPQEKIHVMTDRGAYMSGDTIRLRAWVVDAATHRPVSASKFVYVELLAPTDSLCERVKYIKMTMACARAICCFLMICPRGVIS